MIREYTDKNVYEALLNRLKFIFEEFDNIYVSFSGGKDSGLLLNVLLDFRKSIIRTEMSVCFIRILKRSIL